MVVHVSQSGESAIIRLMLAHVEALQRLSQGACLSQYLFVSVTVCAAEKRIGLYLTWLNSDVQV